MRLEHVRFHAPSSRAFLTLSYSFVFQTKVLQGCIGKRYKVHEYITRIVERNTQFSYCNTLIPKASFRDMPGTNFDPYIMKGLDASCKGRSSLARINFGSLRRALDN